jgi:WD40 repeat protein
MTVYEVPMKLIERFRGYPYWGQVAVTMFALSVMVIVWSSCGIGPRGPAPQAIRVSLDLQNTDGVVRSLAFSSTEKWLAAGHQSGVIALRDTKTGAVLQRLDPHRGKLLAMEVSPNGALLAGAYEDSSIVLWDASKKEVSRVLSVGKSHATDLAFSSDSRLLASSGDDDIVRIWNPSSGEHIRNLEGHTAKVNAVAFAPSRRVIASGSDDQTIRIWNFDTGAQVKIISLHLTPVLALTFSPDGRFLASASTDSLRGERSKPSSHLEILNTQNWSKVHNFPWDVSHADVRCLAFSPDSKLLARAIGLTAGTWDTERWRAIGLLYPNSNYVRVVALAFSPDGRLLVTAEADGRIRFWQEHPSPSPEAPFHLAQN